MEDLLRAWHTLLARHSTSPDVDATGRAVLACWTQPHRRYHDVGHLRGVLTAVGELSDYAADADAVAVAAWYHDAVYAGRPDDEERSAVMAESDLTALGVSPAFIAEVGRLIRMTVLHDPASDDRNGQVLSDADLATLALPPEQYRHNTADIRLEYAHVSDADFRAGRARMIATMLSAPQLYRTPQARQHWEATARANLADELAMLA